MSEVSPNLLALSYPTTTSVKLQWSINGDTPPSITIKDECSGLSLITLEGAYGGSYTLQDLPVNQQYRIFLQSNYRDGPLNSNVQERYPGKPCAAAKPTAPLFPALAWNGLPKTLNDSNQIVVTCVNANSFDYWIISVNGEQQGDQLSGTETFRFPSNPQMAFTLCGDGYLSATGYTGWSPSVSAKAVANSNSVRQFLHNSGVDGSNGLGAFITSSHSTSVRNMLGL